jgi:hypothetical protein
MEMFWTIITGVLVFLIGQAVLKFLFEPLQEFRRTVSEIAHALIEYANIYSNPGVGEEQKLREAVKALRNLSSKLYAQMYLTPKYAYIAKVLCFPSEKSVWEAATNLIGLSNSVFSGNALVNAKRANKIRKALGIYIPEGERDEA